MHKLLEIVRQTLSEYLHNGQTPHWEISDPELIRPRGCFVTLYKQGALRGCVGTFEGTKPLFENVIRMAHAAAFQDSRFAAVGKEDLESLKIEISVLGELRKAASLEEIELGRHGVLVKAGSRTGTFLPEVAVEQKWSREEFVTYCAREKAGLRPADIAKAEIFIYEVEKFKEA